MSGKESKATNRAVIYARFSSHNQREESIEGQLRDCYAYAKRYGLIVVGEYIDRAMSGTTDDRPDFQRMIADAENKQFDRIIVWKLDRFARNRYDSALYKHKLKQYGVRVVSAMENVGEGDESILLEALLEASAEYYSLDLSKKIRRGQKENILNGKFNGGAIPYGYKLQDGKLVIDAKAAEAIRYLFEQYAENVPLRKIVEELNNRGFRTTGGSQITLSTFQRALKNTVYIGEYRYGGEVIQGLAEPIVDRDTFDRVQYYVKKHARAPGASLATEPYLLQGKAFCGHCGSHMVGESGHGKNGTGYRYYACAERKRRHSCEKKNERKNDAEKFVVEQTIAYVLTPSRIEKIAEAVVEQYDNEFSKSKITDSQKAIRQIDGELHKLIDALLDSPKSARTLIYEKIDQLEKQKTAMEDDLSKLQAANKVRLTKDEVIEWLEQFCQGDILDPEFRRKIVEIFVNSVYFFDDRIVIFYNIKGGKDTVYMEPMNFSDELSDVINGSSPMSIMSEPVLVVIDGHAGYILYKDSNM